MKKTLMPVILAFSSQVVAQGSFSCIGHVQTIAIGPQSAVLQVDTGQGMHYICSFKEEMNGVHPETCKAWYALFLSAQASHRQVGQSYSGSSGTNCSTLGNWTVPNPVPYYVSLTE